MSFCIRPSTSSNTSSSSKSSLRSRVLNWIRNLTTSTSSFNRPTADQYCSNDLQDKTAQVSLQQDGQQGHEDDLTGFGPDAHCCQETDSESIFFPKPKKYWKKNSFSGWRFFSQTLRLTLCATILLTLLPCGQGAPVTEPDSLIYQENLSRSKRFIVHLLIGAFWGWITRPFIIPSAFPTAASNQTSNWTA